MPPKKSSANDDGAGLTEEQQAAQKEHQRILDKALRSKILSKQDAAGQPDCLRPSKALIRCNGKDISKKSSTRKNRYLLVFNAKIAPAKGGTLGTLAKLDTKNPVLYMDFPTGRLKFFGTLVFPKNKYMMLKAGQGADVLCEDVFENMVVFSEAWWVGTTQENPEEKKLPFPDSLHVEKMHEEYDYAFGASDEGRKDAVSKTAAASKPKPAEKRGRQEGEEGNEAVVVQDDSDSDDELLTARLKRRKNVPDKAQAGPEGGEEGKTAKSEQQEAGPDVKEETEAEEQHDHLKLTANGKAPEDTPRRRTSLRLGVATKNYAEDSDQDKKDDDVELDDDGDADVDDGNADDETDGSEKKGKRKPQSKGAGVNSRAGKSDGTKEAPPSSGKQRRRTSKGGQDDAPIVLDSSDDEAPAKPARPSRTPQKRPPTAQKAGAQTKTETIELLDTPSRGTPNRRASKDNATKRLAALRESAAGLEEESDKESAEDGEEGEEENGDQMSESEQENDSDSDFEA